MYVSSFNCLKIIIMLGSFCCWYAFFSFPSQFAFRILFTLVIHAEPFSGGVIKTTERLSLPFCRVSQWKRLLKKVSRPACSIVMNSREQRNRPFLMPVKIRKAVFPCQKVFLVLFLQLTCKASTSHNHIKGFLQYYHSCAPDQYTLLYSPSQELSSSWLRSKPGLQPHMKLPAVSVQLCSQTGGDSMHSLMSGEKKIINNKQL